MTERTVSPGLVRSGHVTIPAASKVSRVVGGSRSDVRWLMPVGWADDQAGGRGQTRSGAGVSLPASTRAGGQT